MNSPVCVPCKVLYRPKMNGYEWIEGYPNTLGPIIGDWRPYRVWQGDLWECPTCGHRVVCGHGAKPLAEKHHEGFAKYVDGADSQDVIERAE